MTALFIITLVLLAAAIYAAVFYYRRAKLYERAYRAEVRGQMVERIGYAVGYLGALFLIRRFFNSSEE